MNILIRRATFHDADAVFDLAHQFATSFAIEDAAFQDAFVQLVAKNEAYLAVAEAEQRVVGYVLVFCHLTFFANGRVAWVEELMVQDDFRQRGIGRALMRSAEAWAVKMQCRLLALATRRAAPFYDAIGYEESAIYFRKLLTGFGHEQETS